MSSGKSNAVQEPLFPKHYWARPIEDKPSALENDCNPIFLAVGHALTAWETAECALANLFQMMSRAETANAHNAVRRAFGSRLRNGLLPVPWTLP